VNSFTNFGSLQRRMRRISTSTVSRLSLYLRTLGELEREGVAVASSERLAVGAGTSAAQVRKDLSRFGTFGKRGSGYAVTALRSALRRILGLERSWRVALVGAGRLGSALFGYGDFRRQGFVVDSVYDADPAKVGDCWDGVVVRSVDGLEAALRADGVDMVMVAVPAAAAQAVVDRVVAAGVAAILNFAPVKLRVPQAVTLRSVNMTMELEGLSYALAQREAAAGGSGAEGKDA
jgi:redox-sensing transcriptional repressor